MLTFEIQDNGVGVSDEDLEHVFDPFFTRRADGTGLGLAVTQKIVESFGGSISLEPAKGAGTIVRMNKKCKQYKAKLNLCSIAPDILQVFKITKLHKLIELHNDTDKAVSSLR